MVVPLEEEPLQERLKERRRVVRWDEVALAFTTLLFATTLHPIGYVIGPA